MPNFAKSQQIDYFLETYLFVSSSLLKWLKYWFKSNPNLRMSNQDPTDIKIDIKCIMIIKQIPFWDLAKNLFGFLKQIQPT